MYSGVSETVNTWHIWERANVFGTTHTYIIPGSVSVSVSGSVRDAFASIWRSSSACMRICMYVCVCVRERRLQICKTKSLSEQVQQCRERYIYIDIINVHTCCVDCVCVCVCVRVCMCVCVCTFRSQWRLWITKRFSLRTEFVTGFAFARLSSVICIIIFTISTSHYEI